MHRVLAALLVVSAGCHNGAAPAPPGEIGRDDASTLEDSAVDATGIDASGEDSSDIDSSDIDSSGVDSSGVDSSGVDAPVVFDAPVSDTAVVDASPPPAPRLGAHAVNHYRYSAASPTILSLPALTTQAAGSTIVVSAGRGDISAFALPTDNKGNPPYPQLGTTHKYTKWTSSGTAVYALTSAKGGAGHVISTTTPSNDEITMFGVEVVNGKTIVDAQWTEVLLPAPLKSKSVTTTGPATLIAFWWGDGYFETTPQTAVANNGFTVIDSVLETGSFVQGAVAVKSVSTAGTWDVTWTSTPAQGAQLWLIAVQ